MYIYSKFTLTRTSTCFDAWLLQLGEMLTDSKEEAASDVLLFLREAVHKFEQLRAPVIGRLLDSLSALKSPKYCLPLTPILHITVTTTVSRSIPLEENPEINYYFMYMYCKTILVLWSVSRSRVGSRRVLLEWRTNSKHDHHSPPTAWRSMPLVSCTHTLHTLVSVSKIQQVRIRSWNCIFLQLPIVESERKKLIAETASDPTAGAACALNVFELVVE